jgi:hypothetical protein
MNRSELGTAEGDSYSSSHLRSMVVSPETTSSGLVDDVLLPTLLAPISVGKVDLSTLFAPISVGRVDYSILFAPLSVGKVDHSMLFVPLSVGRVDHSMLFVPISVKRADLSILFAPISVGRVDLSMLFAPISVGRLNGHVLWLGSDLADWPSGDAVVPVVGNDRGILSLSVAKLHAAFDSFKKLSNRFAPMWNLDVYLLIVVGIDEAVCHAIAVVDILGNVLGFDDAFLAEDIAVEIGV